MSFPPVLRLSFGPVALATRRKEAGAPSALFGGSLMRFIRPFLVVLACLLIVSIAGAADHFAAPNGSPAGDGSIGNPWDLDTALGSPGGSPPSSVQPGDTIWLLPGTYVAATSDGFFSHVNGTASAPIIVRNYQGGHVTLDGGTDFAALTANGTY